MSLNHTAFQRRGRLRGQTCFLHTVGPKKHPQKTLIDILDHKPLPLTECEREK